MNPFLDPDTRLLIGHRGQSATAPENTIPAFQEAVDLGVDALELDVHLSADAVPVVLHDPTLDRTTSGTGRVGNHTVRELQSLCAGVRFGERYATARIPTLEEVLDRFRDVPIIIEVKEEAAVEATERLVRRMAATERTLLGSTTEAVVQRLYRTGLATCASVKDAALLLSRAVLGQAPGRGRYQVLSIAPTYYGVPVPIQLMASAARRSRIPTHVWTVNDPVQARRLWEAGVNAVLSDDPAAMVGVRPR